MYEEHFGLSKNPFQSVAEGEAVFEGPAQTKVIADLKTALTARDSIAVITGPVGVGKTTIVQRAMEQMGPERLVAILGRSQVGPDELVDLLLAQFGVVREPTRRFECLKTFNRILNERAESGARVFVVIEDAERLGAELLEELEALTASDGGACAGANIILMGPQKLDKLITKPSLERVRQRIRLQQTLDRFTADEVELYLRHRIEAAGGAFDAIFEQGSALMVRRCSGGIPRVVNSLCETALTVAAEGNLSQLSGKVVFKVAVEVFGLSPGDVPMSQTPKVAPKPMAPAAKPPAPQPAAKAPQPAPPPPAEPEPAAKKPEPVAKEPAAVKASPVPPVEKTSDPTVPVPTMPAGPQTAGEPQQTTTPRAPKAPANATPAKPAAAPANPPAAPAAANGAGVAAATPKTEPSRLPDLPGLGVKDTAAPKAKPAADKPLPELPPKFKFADEIVVDRDTKPKLPVQPPKKVEPVELPTLEFDEGKPKIADQKPATEKAPVPPSAAVDDIPTLGESARVEIAAPPVKKQDPKPAAKPASPPPAAAKPTNDASFEEPSPPAKRLDMKDDEPTASFAKVDHDMLDAALADLAVHDEEDGPDPEIEAAEAEQPPQAIPEVTLDKSIEAKQAEARAATDTATFKKMAAELEQAESLEDVSDKLAETLFGCEELEAISLQIREEAVPPEDNPVALEPAEAAAAPVADTPAPPPEPPKAAPPPQPPKAAPPPQPPAAPKAPPARKPAAKMDGGPAAAAAPPPATKGPQPEPIENQFNTSMTATLKTLNTHTKPPADDDDGEQSSGGLLGKIKNSFKS